MTLEELKQCPHGTQIVGLPLVIKTARTTFLDGDEKAWQEVVFMDMSGEMTGVIALPEYSPSADGSKYDSRIKVPPTVWRSKARIFIMEGEIQDTDVRKKETRKIIVYRCRDMAVRLTYDQYNELSESEGQDWQAARQEEIRGKCRYGVVCASIQSGKLELSDFVGDNLTTKGIRTVVNIVVEFIMTGK